MAAYKQLPAWKRRRWPWLYRGIYISLYAVTIEQALTPMEDSSKTLMIVTYMSPSTPPFFPFLVPRQLLEEVGRDSQADPFSLSDYTHGN